MARSKSGRSRRRTEIRHRQKRRKDRRKLARKLGVSIEDLLAMMKKGRGEENLILYLSFQAICIARQHISDEGGTCLEIRAV